MRKTVQVFIVLGIILVTFVLPVILFQVSQKPGKVQNAGVTQTPTVIESTNTIRFDSIPPVVAVTGGTFMYQVRVSDTKGEKVTLLVQEKPDWLEWDSQTLVLRGTVPKSGATSFSVVIKASNEKGQVETQSFTVAIEEANTQGLQEVKGAKDRSWDDPFHPTRVEADVIYEDLLPTETEEDVLGITSAPTNSPTPVQNNDDNSSYTGVYIGAGIAVGILLLGAFSLVMNSDRSQFIKGTGKLIVERGRR